MPDALGGYAFRQVNSFAGMDKMWNYRNTKGTDHTEGASVVSEVSVESVELVSRPRLTERLNEGVTRKLTVVSAPAGFGKTTLPAVCICAKAAVGV